MTTESAARKASDYALLALFLATISLPMLGLVLPQAEIDTREQRTRAKLPPLPGLHRSELRNYPRQFECYFNDHFVGRDTLIHWHKLAQFHALGTSQAEIAVKANRAINDDSMRNSFASVLRGKGNWLFFAGERALESYQGKQPFSASELDDWSRVLQARHDWLAQRGIAYAVVVAPNKHSIHGEQIPDFVRIVNQRRRFDALREHLEANTSVHLINVHHALLAGKAREQTYDITGTHWNDWGAYLAYREIGAQLARRFPAFQARAIDQFKLQVEETPGIELAVMLGMEDQLKERRVTLLPREPRLAVGDREVPWQPDHQYATHHPDSTLPRLLVFHDSFMIALQPYLSEHFSAARYHWSRWENLSNASQMIEEFRPDIVLEELVERRLEHHPPTNPPELLPSSFRMAEQPASGTLR